jgi:outer membrane protein
LFVDCTAIIPWKIRENLSSPRWHGRWHASVILKHSGEIMKHFFALFLSVSLAAQAQDREPLIAAPASADRLHGIFRPYEPRNVSLPSFENSPRLHDLIRGGNLQLSLSDAISLAIENNLDVELERYAIPLARTEAQRAEGGGLPRGILFTLAQPPTGVGGPLSPLLTQAATQSTPGTTVASNALELGVLAEPQVNLSLLGTISLSNGSPLPAFDPVLTADYNWSHQIVAEVDPAATGVALFQSNVTTGNVGVNQGFSYGTNVNLSFNNTETNTNATTFVVNPYINADLALTVTQPLLRGFGQRVNRRFIRVAVGEEKISSLLFRQQLIELVYGVVRLYTDLVALAEDVKVKEETLGFAQKLLADNQAQVEEGTLAPLELSRARAQVSASRQDLITSRGLLREQEAILKNVLTRRGSEDADVRNARIIPTDSLNPPDQDQVKPLEQLLAEAYKQRPDLAQAGLQVEISRESLQGSRNNLRPELDLVGTAQNNALAGQPVIIGAPSATFSGGYGSVLDQLATRKNPTYAIGFQLTLPLRNRVAQADAVRDEMQVRQTQVRERQLRNQAQLEVEDALIAMERAHASYEAAAETRALQEQSLELEQTRYNEGVSTTFFVIQYQSYVAQAKSAEVAAKSAYIKAKAALERAVGSILDDQGVQVQLPR